MLLSVLASILVFGSPASPRELVTDQAAFEPFGRAVAAEVTRQLAHPEEIPERAMGTLLTIEVHWAIHAGDAKAALNAAAQIQARLVQPEQKAYAGVTTQAIVAADEAVRHDRGSPRYSESFRAEFVRRLAALPQTPGMRAVLIEQRKSIAALNEAGLLADIERHIPAGSHDAGYSLEQANEIIRARHKLVDLAPILPVMLSALDAAAAARLNSPGG